MNKSKILLLLPPFYTPYTPPLGISILKAYLERRGHSVFCFDFNTVPDIWQAHHRYFKHVQQLEGLDPHDGYVNLWYILQAHMLAHVNGLDRKACGRMLSMLLPIYGITPARDILDRLGAIVAGLFDSIADVLARKVQPGHYEFVGTSTYSTSLGPSLFIHKLAKSLWPHVTTVMGGGAFADDLALGSANLETLVREYDCVDHIIVGEGELLFTRLIEGGFSGRKLLSMEDLGSEKLAMRDVPVPDFTDFDMGNYLQLSIEGARSCPFQCNFCSETVQWGEYRKKPSGVLASQMTALARGHGIKTFFMGDSLMNPYIHDLSNSLLAGGADVLYDGYLRADKIAVDRDRMKRWASSGLFRARLGIESASANVLDAMQKMTAPGTISEVLRSLTSAGIRTSTLWIVGFPGETESDFQETLDFIREHHRFIFELEVHYYYYYPYGQIWSRLHQCDPLYSGELIRAVKFQQWEITGCNPGREEKFDRLRRFNALAGELHIPHLHSLEARYSAEERWRDLAPRARDYLAGVHAARPKIRLPEARVPALPGQWRGSTETSSVVCYSASAPRAVNIGLLTSALQRVHEVHEMLQMAMRDESYVAAGMPAPEDAALTVQEYEMTGEIEARRTSVIDELGPALRPEPGRSVKLAVWGTSDGRSELLLMAHRGLADAASLAFLFEDLWSVYEQLSAGVPVWLRPPGAPFTAYAAGRVPAVSLNAVPAAALPPLRPVRAIEARLQPDIARGVLSDSWKAHGLTPSDLMLGGLCAAIAESCPERPGCPVEVVHDLRQTSPSLDRTVGPLTAVAAIAAKLGTDGDLLSGIRQLRKSLCESGPMQALSTGSGDSGPRFRINLEYMPREPWLGGDEWGTRGYIPQFQARSSPQTVELMPIRSSDGIVLRATYAEDAGREGDANAVVAATLGAGGFLNKAVSLVVTARMEEERKPAAPALKSAAPELKSAGRTAVRLVQLR